MKDRYADFAVRVDCRAASEFVGQPSEFATFGVLFYQGKRWDFGLGGVGSWGLLLLGWNMGV